MGWTGEHGNGPGRSAEDLKAYFEKEFGLPIVKGAVRGGVYYAAVQSARKPGCVFGLVVLMETSDGEFRYKEMSEEMGPYYFDCPESVLDELTPTEDKTAETWRAKCRMKAATGNEPSIEF
jgi:hypothetical protein